MSGDAPDGDDQQDSVDKDLLGVVRAEQDRIVDERKEAKRKVDAIYARFHDGAVFDKYRIIGRLDSGHFGAVFAAIDDINRDVALKVIPIADEARRDAAWREAVALGALEHPDIVRLYTHLSSAPPAPAGSPPPPPDATVLVLERVSGTRLHQHMESARRTWDQVAPIAERIAGALQFAHAKGVTHGDIHPGNVLVQDRRHVKLVDFGLARFEHTADEAARFENASPEVQDALAADPMVGGVHAFMAPEVKASRGSGAASDGGSGATRGEAPLDKRTDIYSFGVLMLWMLCGKQVLGEDLPAWSILSARLAAAGTPSRVSELLERCVATNPAERPSMETIAAALHAVWVDKPRRSPMLWIALTVLTALAAVGAIVIAGRMMKRDRTRSYALDFLERGRVLRLQPTCAFSLYFAEASGPSMIDSGPELLARAPQEWHELPAVLSRNQLIAIVDPEHASVRQAVGDLFVGSPTVDGKPLLYLDLAGYSGGALTDLGAAFKEKRDRTPSIGEVPANALIVVSALKAPDGRPQARADLLANLANLLATCPRCRVLWLDTTDDGMRQRGFSIWRYAGSTLPAAASFASCASGGKPSLATQILERKTAIARALTRLLAQPGYLYRIAGEQADATLQSQALVKTVTAPLLRPQVVTTDATRLAADPGLLVGRVARQALITNGAFRYDAGDLTRWAGGDDLERVQAALAPVVRARPGGVTFANRTLASILAARSLREDLRPGELIPLYPHLYDPAWEEVWIWYGVLSHQRPATPAEQWPFLERLVRLEDDAGGRIGSILAHIAVLIGPEELGQPTYDWIRKQTFDARATEPQRVFLDEGRDAALIEEIQNGVKSDQCLDDDDCPYLHWAVAMDPNDAKPIGEDRLLMLALASSTAETRQHAADILCASFGEGDHVSEAVMKLDIPHYEADDDVLRRVATCFPAERPAPTWAATKAGELCLTWELNEATFHADDLANAGFQEKDFAQWVELALAPGAGANRAIRTAMESAPELLIPEDAPGKRPAVCGSRWLASLAPAVPLSGPMTARLARAPKNGPNALVIALLLSASGVKPPLDTAQALEQELAEPRNWKVVSELLRVLGPDPDRRAPPPAFVEMVSKALAAHVTAVLSPNQPDAFVSADVLSVGRRCLQYDCGSRIPYPLPDTTRSLTTTEQELKTIVGLMRGPDVVDRLHECVLFHEDSDHRIFCTERLLLLPPGEPWLLGRLDDPKASVDVAGRIFLEDRLRQSLRIERTVAVLKDWARIRPPGMIPVLFPLLAETLSAQGYYVTEKTLEVHRIDDGKLFEVKDASGKTIMDGRLLDSKLGDGTLLCQALVDMDPEQVAKRFEARDIEDDCDQMFAVVYAYLKLGRYHDALDVFEAQPSVREHFAETVGVADADLVAAVGAAEVFARQGPAAARRLLARSPLDGNRLAAFKFDILQKMSRLIDLDAQAGDLRPEQRAPLEHLFNLMPLVRVMPGAFDATSYHADAPDPDSGLTQLYTACRLRTSNQISAATALACSDARVLEYVDDTLAECERQPRDTRLECRTLVAATTSDFCDQVRRAEFIFESDLAACRASPSCSIHYLEFLVTRGDLAAAAALRDTMARPATRTENVAYEFYGLVLDVAAGRAANCKKLTEQYSVVAPGLATAWVYPGFRRTRGKAHKDKDKDKEDKDKDKDPILVQISEILERPVTAENLDDLQNVCKSVGP